MPQSLTRLYGHLVFSTKDRWPWLNDSVRSRVHAYLATTVRSLGAPWVVAGGVADHVHLLFDLGRMVAPVMFVEQVKRESSKFVKTLGAEYRTFYWQRGYGFFSVSPQERDVVENYIRNQEEHHQTLSFQDEYRAMLDRMGIEFDEQYVWD